MAKATKKELTPVEKLEQALVPEEEQPYAVPENWVWARLGKIAIINPPKLKSDMIPHKVSFVPMAAVSGTEGRIVDVIERISTEVSSGYTNFIENDLLFAKITPCMENGKIALAKNLINGVGFGTTEFYVFRSSFAVINSFLYHYLRAKWFRDLAAQNMSGAVGQQRVRKEFLDYHALPLPPLAEQQRIVDRIESLFEKLDQAKELVQSALDAFETRKAAILHKAFTGELTDKWREVHRITGQEKVTCEGTQFSIPSNWKWVTLNDVAQYKKGPFGSSITKAMFVPKGDATFKVYEQGNAIRKTLDYGNYYISPKKYDELKGFSISPGDIIVSCAGTIGETYRLPGNCEKGVINQALMRVRIFDNVLYDFFVLYFGEVLKMDIEGRAKGTAIKNIPPFTILKKMPFPLPSIIEQQEIVRILDKLFEKEQQAKELYDVIDKIDLMKKAILARAFRGQLGTNDPSEESAMELLKMS